MRWVFVALVLFATGCSINYSSPSASEGGGEIYRINKTEAFAVTDEYLDKKEREDIIDSYIVEKEGFSYKIKGIESKIIFVEVSEPEGVVLDVSGGGGYIAGQMVPDEFRATMEIIEGVKQKLEENSIGVIRPSKGQVVRDVYP
jgi:hypothetical protein